MDQFCRELPAWSLSSDSPGGFLALGDAGGVRTPLHAVVEISPGFFQGPVVLEQIDGAQGEDLGGDDQTTAFRVFPNRNSLP
jgi:hypothetical protein